MRFDILTLFPAWFEGPLTESIIRRAREAGIIRIEVHDLRGWTEGKHQVADDTPFGGGDGMVMKPEPLCLAVEAVKKLAPESPVILLSPQGRRLDQREVNRLAKLPGLILVCGRYAGLDERAVELAVDEELSVGDYVLSGGEPAAAAVLDAVARQVPGVLGNEMSPAEDSFPERLEYPQYTRPAEFRGLKVPEILLSGHHANIRRWRKKESLRRTLERRPDLFDLYPPDDDEEKLLAEIRAERDLK